MIPQRLVLAALTTVLATASPGAFADKGGKQAQGRGQGKSQDERIDDRGNSDSRDHDGVSMQFSFGDRDRAVARDYYGSRVGGGNCPPGLAKKGNGCLPPGQAKKWVKGRTLPRDLSYYAVPHDLVILLPPSPPGHRYVRVAGDILLIAVGSAMVIDAIQDIVR